MFSRAMPSTLRCLSIVTLLCLTTAVSAAPAAGEQGTRLRTIVLDGDSMNVADIVDLASGRALIQVSDAGMQRVRAAHDVVDLFIREGRPAYGITTMYGADFQTTLPPDVMRHFGGPGKHQQGTGRCGVRKLHG